MSLRKLDAKGKTIMQLERRTKEQIVRLHRPPTVLDLGEQGAEAVTEFARAVAKDMLAEGYTSGEAREVTNHLQAEYEPALKTLNDNRTLRNPKPIEPLMPTF